MTSVRKYLARVGSKGGRKSRRVLAPEVARAMVGVREARRAFRIHHALCFWSSPKDLIITASDVPWIAEQLLRHGDRAAYLSGVRLRRLRNLSISIVPLRSHEADTPPAPRDPAARVALVRTLSEMQWRLLDQPAPASLRNAMRLVLRPLHAQGDER